jgi:hypothetical protein
MRFGKAATTVPLFTSVTAGGFFVFGGHGG